MLADNPNLQAVERLRDAAREAGGNAVIAMRFELQRARRQHDRGRRLRHRGPPSATRSYAPTVEGVFGVAVELVAPSSELAVRAGSLRASHYRRRANDVSLGLDCFVLADGLGLVRRS